MMLVGELLRDLWWPIFAVAAILVLLKRMDAIARARVAPGRASAQDIFGGALGTEGLDEPQRAAIRALTADELDVFLLVSYSDQHQYETGLAPEVLLRTLKRLAAARLIAIIDETNPRYVTHETTPLGKRLRALLVSSAAALVRGSV